MIRSAVDWLRVVAPPGWAIGTFLALYVPPLALDYGLAWWWGLPPIGAFSGAICGAVVIWTCVAYSAYRAVAFHPLFRPAYRSWLTLTPWTPQKPLPLGPIHLVPQDAVVLAMMLMLRYGTNIPAWTVPFALLIPYLCVLCHGFWLADLRGTAYLLAFGLGLVARLSFDPLRAFCVVVALYLWTWLGIRRTLARFPWQMPAWWEKLRMSLKGGREATESELGWPFDVLQPKAPDGVRPSDALLISLLAGWLFYVFPAAHPPAGPGREPFLFVIYLYACAAAVVVRIVRYCLHHLPPISLWGRIWTLRWIVPGYDQVFAAPLAACLAAFLAPLGLARLGLPLAISLPAALALVLWIILGMGPSLRHWRLTGSHRIVPMMGRQQFIQL